MFGLDWWERCVIFTQTTSNCGTDPFYSSTNGSCISKVVAERLMEPLQFLCRTKEQIVSFFLCSGSQAVPQEAANSCPTC